MSTAHPPRREGGPRRGDGPRYDHDDGWVDGPDDATRRVDARDGAPPWDETPAGIGRGALSGVGRGLGRATVATARLTGRSARGTVAMARRASRAHGAGESGLYRLIEIHFFSIMGDTLVALALAGTVFFSMPTSGGGSRQQIALFLLLTMLPFIFIAPFIGPFLDRHRHGRRWAIGSMMGLRAILCVVLANSLGELTVTQFAATLGVLVASKADNVSRIAGTPRLLPEQLTLVKANGRMSMAGVVGATLAAPVGVLLGYLGPQWILYLACAVFATATVLSILLPATVDAAPDELDEPLGDRPAGADKRALVPPQVVTGFRVNAGLRALSGFLMVFMAFVMLESPFPGWEGRPTLLLGLVVGAVGVGNAVGTALAALVKSRAPQFMLVLVLLLDAVMAVVTAVHYSFGTTLGIAAVAGAAQQLGKLALDALIQKTVPEEVHTTIFGRSETVLQLSFVLGAFVGLIPMTGEIGMVVAAVLLVAWTLLVLVLRDGRPLPSLVPFMVVRRHDRPRAQRITRREDHVDARAETATPPRPYRAAARPTRPMPHAETERFEAPNAEASRGPRTRQEADEDPYDERY